MKSTMKINTKNHFKETQNSVPCATVLTYFSFKPTGADINTNQNILSRGIVDICSDCGLIFRKIPCLP